MSTPIPSTGYPQAGELLGPFRIDGTLGIGGMGAVFRAVDTQLHREVALKVIAAHLAEDDNFRARFVREAQAQASLDSPHVVGVYSFGETDGRLYIATQLIPDGDLGQMLQAHGSPPRRIAVHLISQIAEALADAHAAGLVHRDIKPANVLLRNRDDELSAYLGDFGIARQVESGGRELTAVGGAVGTPNYMAPELHTGGTAGPASDIYALGCLLWATMTGAPPYAATSDYLIVNGHVEKPVPQLDGSGPLTTEINRVLRIAMAKDPIDRYGSATAMRADLRQVLRLPEDGEQDPTYAGIAAPPPQPPTPTPDPVEAAPPAHDPGADTRVVARSVTPTPEPAPPESHAHDATVLRDPAPVFTPQVIRLPEEPSPRRPPAVVLGAAAAVAVVAVLAVVLVLTLGGGDDEPAPVAQDPATTTGTASASPDGPSREDRAREALSSGFALLQHTDAEASCMADGLIDQLGVDALVEARVLDRDAEQLDVAYLSPPPISTVYRDIERSCRGAGS